MTLQMKTIETKALHYRYFCQYLIFFFIKHNYIFHEACEAGYFGKDCTIPCPPQLYGSGCTVPIVIQSLDAMQETVKYI